MSGLIEGRHPVLEALKAGSVREILIAKNLSPGEIIDEILDLANKKKIPVTFVEKKVLDSKSRLNHQGIIAFKSLPQKIDYQDILSMAEAKGEAPFMVILEGLKDPHNLGAIARTADASGVHGIIIPKRRAVGLTATVAKSSAGATEYVPIAQVSNINYTLKSLKDKDIWTVAVDQEGDTPYTKVDFNLPVALVIGSEGEGLSRMAKENCDIIVNIPMKGSISSLNASVAAAIVMYEVLRQRESAKK